MRDLSGIVVGRDVAAAVKRQQPGAGNRAEGARRLAGKQQPVALAPGDRDRRGDLLATAELLASSAGRVSSNHGAFASAADDATASSAGTSSGCAKNRLNASLRPVGEPAMRSATGSSIRAARTALHRQARS